MDTQVATATTQAEKLRKKIAELNERRRELESKHAKERAALARVEDTRVALIKELAGADIAMEGWANSEIDKLDSQILTLTRKTSGLESALAAVAVEVEPFTRELVEVQRVIQDRERAATLKVFEEKMQYAAGEAEKALAHAREALACLNRTAADGVAAYGDA